MSNAKEIFIKHIAGEFAYGIQHCIFCGKLLADYRNAISPDGFIPKGWEENHAVYQKGNLTTTMIGEEKFIECSVFE